VEAIERLQKQWRDDARFHGLHASMHLEKEALVLGANTVLAKRDEDGGLAIDGDEARLLTLLAVAYGQPVDSSVLASIRGASKFARAGDECMAAMRLALARLPQLADPEDAARRLFIADGLIAEGTAPRDIWCALEFDPALLDRLQKYSPSELRNPKGDGRISGRWTNGSAAAEEVTAESLSSRIASLTARLLGRGTGRAAGLVVPVVGELLAMTNSAGNWPSHGDVPGRPDLRYAFDADEHLLRIYQTPYPIPLVEADLLGGEFRDRRRQRKVARLLDKGIQFDPDALPPERPSPDAKGRRRPRLCIVRLPDKAGNTNPLDLDYEDFVKKKQNTPPTRRGYGYWLLNPIDGRAVVVDDCRLRTDTPIEAKRGYSDLVASAGGRIWMAVDWGYQATRQEEASYGGEIEWHFSDKPAADWARKVFSWLPWLKNVNVMWDPWKGHK
jgi:hypothetical protein